jgi:hypothetical protein
MLEQLPIRESARSRTSVDGIVEGTWNSVKNLFRSPGKEVASIADRTVAGIVKFVGNSVMRVLGGVVRGTGKILYNAPIVAFPR